jgi:hypothetical protein
MEIHPAAQVLPLMSEERLTELTEDIKAHGLRCRIVTYEGLLLDGRNRRAACDRAGITPEFEDGTSKINDPVAYVISVNLKRRDLTTDQRAACVAELATLKVGANQHRGREGVQNCTPSPTLDQAAKLAGVSRRTVANAKKRMRDDPVAHAAAKRGDKVKRPRQAKPVTQTPEAKAPETPPESEETTPQQLWAFHCGEFLGEVAAMRAAFAREFGPEWTTFPVPSWVLRVAKEAQRELTELVKDFSVRRRRECARRPHRVQRLHT